MVPTRDSLKTSVSYHYFPFLGSTFRTLAIIPTGIHGEACSVVKYEITPGTFYRVAGPCTAKRATIYAGNLAILFVQAYVTMKKNGKLGM